jgi:hypothetical protein
MAVPSQRTSELMIRYYTGEITPEEQEELDNSIASKPEAKQQWYRDRLDPEKVAQSRAFAKGVDREKYRRQREARAQQKWQQ